MGRVRRGDSVRSAAGALGPALGRAALSLGVVSAYGLARTARLVPVGRRAGWRDDAAFAELVGPLSRSLRWRLRTLRHRLASAVVAGPRARATHAHVRTVGGIFFGVVGVAAAASVVVVVLADAYATPLRLSLPVFG